MEEQDKIIKNTQKIIDKLISEEIIATSFYYGALDNVDIGQRGFIQKKFAEIAEDEFMDHANSLRKFATENGFEVPFKFKDMEKHASKKMVAKFNNMKSRETALYYIEQAIESEQEAIKSYEECMQQEYLNDLQPILLKCYYDEIQHLENLETLMSCVSIGVELK